MAKSPNPPADEATLRDMFAASALEGLLANDSATLDAYQSSVCKHYAETAYRLADAMLDARKAVA